MRLPSTEPLKLYRRRMRQAKSAPSTQAPSARRLRVVLSRRDGAVVVWWAGREGTREGAEGSSTKTPREKKVVGSVAAGGVDTEVTGALDEERPPLAENRFKCGQIAHGGIGLNLPKGGVDARS